MSELRAWRKLPDDLLEVQPVSTVERALIVLDGFQSMEKKQVYGLEEKVGSKWVEWSDSEGRDIHQLLADRTKKPSVKVDF